MALAGWAVLRRKAVPDATETTDVARPPSPGKRRPGHGRQGAETYRGAEHVVCHHETLAAGERCPVCGRGRLYRVAPGVEIRLDGHALLSAVRYVLEKFRCSACGQVFTASAPAEAGADKYSARARAVLVLGRYYLGVPLYRLEGYQAMVGVPVADATQWDQIERVADCAYPVFEQLKTLAAQGEVIYQDDTHVRILSLIAENRRTQADDTSEGRTGMYTTGLVVQQDEHTICLYFAGRAHAGENLEALLTLREAGRDKPLVMSDALASNTADEGALIRCHCLAHGRRKFSELEETFPAECSVVIDALKHVFDHEEEARVQQLNPTDRLIYHQHYSGPIMQEAQALAGAAVRGAQCRAQQQFRESVCLSPDPLADADAISGGAGGAPGEQHGGAGVEAGDSPAEKQSLLRHGLQRLHRQHAHQPHCHLRASRGECVRLSGRLARASRRGLSGAGGVAPVELSDQPGPALSQLLPIVRHPGLLGIAIPQHDGQLARRQAGTGVLGGGPPREVTLRQPLRAQPVALPVIAQDFQGGASAVPEDVERTAERIVAERAAADRGEPIDAFTEIDGLRGHKDPTLRGELEHQGVSKKVRSRVARGRCASEE